MPLLQLSNTHYIQPRFHHAFVHSLFLSIQHISFLHFIPPSLRDTSIIQLLLQPRYLLQALRIPNQPFHPLLLLIRQLHPVRFVARRTTGSGAVGQGGGRDVEGAGFDAHDLGVSAAFLFGGGKGERGQEDYRVAEMKKDLHTFEASAEGSSNVPNSSVALSRSTSFTF